MEDFSNFISEEIFILYDSAKKDSGFDRTYTHYKLGVVYGDISSEENDLLDKILQALNFAEDDILKANKIDTKKCEKWLIFADSHDTKSENENLEFYKPSTHQGNVFLLAQPLSTLQYSKEEKHKLWNVLKTLFGI